MQIRTERQKRDPNFDKNQQFRNQASTNMPQQPQNDDYYQAMAQDSKYFGTENRANGMRTQMNDNANTFLRQ